MQHLIQGFEIEPTNMCTLKCPQCSRTDFINKFPKQWKNKNLNFDHLKNFIDIDISNFKVNFCGNYGDPIYYDQLFDMVNWFKNKNCLITICTNGSYKSAAWWEQLSDMLTANDQIVFGIDGMPDNFTQYRINADWSSIKVAIDTLSNKSVKKVWQFIPFNYNEHQLDQAKQLSESLGFDSFYRLDSNRWDQGSEELRPKTVSPVNFVKNNWLTTKTTEIDPECTKLKTKHYISADGFYSSCCYAADHRWYYKSEFFKNKEEYDISKTTISQILSNLNDYYNHLEDAKLNYCTFSCPKL